MVYSHKNETIDVITSKIGKVLTSKSVGTGPSSYENRIYMAAVSQRLRNAGVGEMRYSSTHS